MHIESKILFFFLNATDISVIVLKMNDRTSDKKQKTWKSA